MFAGAAVISSIRCLLAAPAAPSRLTCCTHRAFKISFNGRDGRLISMNRPDNGSSKRYGPRPEANQYRDRPNVRAKALLLVIGPLTDVETACCRTLRLRMRRDDVAPIAVSSSWPHSLRFARDRRCGHCDRRGPRGRTAAVMCESPGGPDIAVSRYLAEGAGEAARAGERSGSPDAAGGLRGVDRSLRHLPTRRRKDHMLQYRNRLPGPGGGVPAQRARTGEETRELTGCVPNKRPFACFQ